MFILLTELPGIHENDYEALLFRNGNNLNLLVGESVECGCYLTICSDKLMVSVPFEDKRFSVGDNILSIAFFF